MRFIHLAQCAGFSLFALVTTFALGYALSRDLVPSVIVAVACSTITLLYTGTVYCWLYRRTRTGIHRKSR